ncbi:MAG: hypothetical protein HY735_01230 [Verrucomicrobia bacterium]|nr:hypothetical protein [Verrucomicrobiota bacterium]
MGSTGSQPVATDNLPDGTGATPVNKPAVDFLATLAAIPVGKLPTGAGRFPAPLILQKNSERT